MTAASSPSTRKSIRPHRKSRAGCSLCKRRKVKCGEEKPCRNCISFGLPCDLVSDGERVEYSTAPAARRGRGRPRKIWTGSVQSPNHCSAATGPSHIASPLSRRSPTCSPLPVDVDPARIDLDNAELLLHFVTTTAETFAGGESPGLNRFWTRNAPQIGLSHAFVLHLIFASAAFHLAYLAKEESEQGLIDINAQLPPHSRGRAGYLFLAQQHLTAGASGFSRQLSRPGPDNCGALYLGAVLTSYCTFAAGPTSRDDLLVCTADAGDTQDATAASSSSASWMPFVYGVRLMHQSFSPDVLFAGLMAPFRTGPVAGSLEEPVCVQNGFRRLDWEDALDGLREFIARSGVVPGGETGTGSTTAVCFAALDAIIEIYAATYGRRSSPDGDATYTGPSANQFVFGWLYRVEYEFVACVRRREPYALLVLAHYAVLLNGDTIQRGWFIKGWREHIIARVGEFLANGECSEWMRWPMEQAAPKGERRGWASPGLIPG
ncbi:hypothetical protein C8A01DRAFT_12286 [Parachaetomium inaequale]|uniref:Zn(2)-C6 fungal-type domain-containing protein n=1 Tax=Parachaetomium inaequale TaxID=2588326 RepID=A0AAN6PNG9_9PEZI|nr:hypothetical protein C8A01DRAFT_12286 [Parachaetomium inaequale]